jgi:hypothetical protein
MSTAHNIIKTLKHKGNTVIGVGCYSAVMSAKNQNNVIKVGSDTADPCLDFYSHVVSKFNGNQHVPVVHSMYVDNNSDFYVLVMEKLDPIQVKDYDVCKLCKDYCESYITSDQFIIECENYLDYIPNPSKLLEVLKKVKKLAEKLEVKIDMHTGNFMLRDGILVVTDPWSDHEIYDEYDLSLWADENLYNE